MKQELRSYESVGPISPPGAALPGISAIFSNVVIPPTATPDGWWFWTWAKMCAVAPCYSMFIHFCIAPARASTKTLKNKFKGFITYLEV